MAVVIQKNIEKNILKFSNIKTLSNLNGEKILEITGDVSPKITFSSKQNILIHSKSQSFLTHGVHKFPAKFFPELPRYLIQKYSNKYETVLDPMCGSGTVPLESTLLQRYGIGIDIDPIAQLVSKVKTTPLKLNLLHEIVYHIKNRIKKLDSQKATPFIPEFNYRENWFQSYTLREIAIIKKTILEIDFIFSNNNKTDITNIKNFLLVILSSIIRDVSNADPHCTRTVIRTKLKKNIPKDFAYTKFFKNLEKQLNNIETFSHIFTEHKLRKPKIMKNSDARLTKLDNSSIDLAVTSPPYVNAVDYPRTHQLEMYWLELTNGSLSDMKRNYVGTETVYKEEYRNIPYSNYATLNRLVEDVYGEDPRRAYIIYKFFMDMETNLLEMKRVLKNNSRYCVTIGNNTIRGRTVKSNKILEEIAISNNIGFKLENSFFSTLINHFIKIPRKERMNGEWVLILKN